MPQALRVALVGAGRWSRLAHLPAWQAARGARLVAVADPRPERAAAVAAEAGVPAFPSLAAVLGAERVDVVDVASATGSHLTLAQAAIEAGCHVLCEKPIALVSSAAAGLDALARARGVESAVAFAFRHAAAVRAMRTRLQAGALGRIYAVQGFEQNALYHDPSQPKPREWLKADADVGALGEYGSHLVDLVRWLIGEFAEVAGDMRTYLPERAVEGGGWAPSEVDDATAFLARLEGGVQGLFQASWLMTGRAPGVEIRVFGERGGLRLRLSEHPDGGESLEESAIDDGAYHPVDVACETGLVLACADDWPGLYMRRLVQSFVDRLAARPGVVAGFADGAAAQRVLDAVAASSRAHAWQPVGKTSAAAKGGRAR